MWKNKQTIYGLNLTKIQTFKRSKKTQHHKKWMQINFLWIVNWYFSERMAWLTAWMQGCELTENNWNERRRCYRSPLGSRLPTLIVATISIIFFLFVFSPSHPFLIEGVLQSKNLLSKSYSELNNLVVYPFPDPDPVGHFGATWRPFWILHLVRCCRRWARAPGTARLVLIKGLADNS